MLRRRFLQTAATLTAAPYVRTSRAARGLTFACGNHQIPGANTALSKLCSEWGEREKVEVRGDFTDGAGLQMSIEVRDEAGPVMKVRFTFEVHQLRH